MNLIASSPAFLKGIPLQLNMFPDDRLTDTRLPETRSRSEDSNQLVSMETEDPPFYDTYKAIIEEYSGGGGSGGVEERELPVIDLRRLGVKDEAERERCKRDIARASSEWGFFQVVNHGIQTEILRKMREEEVKVFKQPFRKKCEDDRFSVGSYRWGTPSATCLSQLSWSEAFHIPMTDITTQGGATTVSSTMEEFATAAAELAQELAGILAENLAGDGDKNNKYQSFFRQSCLPSTCFLRINRYPPCPLPFPVFGLTPHTDSDFLTLLNQDQVGGLQLVKDGTWITVKPNPQALIINIGDLFQAWSNDVYKSVKHQVVTNPSVERFSAAYFLCPSQETVVQSYCEPSIYKQFSFREYRDKVQQDVRLYGHKIGLSRFIN